MTHPEFAAPNFGVNFEPPAASPFDGVAYGATALSPFAISHGACAECGGNGSTLDASRVFCSGCRWLRPIAPDYALPAESFLWKLDADAMNVLRSLGPLTLAARTVSERVGRPWFEASVNGLRLGEKQLPDIFALAVRAARTLSLPYMPEIYISGDQMWDANTLGTDTNAFVVLGSVLVNFKEDELLFVLGREMGRVRAGHALWRTVTQLLTGRARHRSILGDGILRLINPAKIAESALDAPLMAWSRHSEITADRAGMLCAAHPDIARRVLTTWTLKSFPLQARIDADAWREQERAVASSMSQLAEWTLSNTPYLAGRLRLLDEYASEEQWRGWRAVIEHWLPPLASAPSSNGAAVSAAKDANGKATRTPPADDPSLLRLICPHCNEGLRIPRTALAGTDPVNVRCPNPKCRVVLTVTPKVPVQDPAAHAEG